MGPDFGIAKYALKAGMKMLREGKNWRGEPWIDEKRLSEARVKVLYDTFHKKGSTYAQIKAQRTSLFGNGRVGLIDLCNLDIAGALACDNAFMLTHVRWVVSFDQHHDEICRRMMRDSQWELIIADSLQYQNHVSPNRWVQVNLVIPARQNFKVTITLENNLREYLQRYKNVEGAIRCELAGVEVRDIL